jgi:hypothetical protein
MAEYTHRKRVDGTWDSICMICYHTATKSLTEPELRESEAGHKCVGSPQSQPVIQAFDFIGKRTD